MKSNMFYAFVKTSPVYMSPTHDVFRCLLVTNHFEFTNFAFKQIKYVQVIVLLDLFRLFSVAEVELILKDRPRKALMLLALV